MSKNSSKKSDVITRARENILLCLFCLILVIGLFIFLYFKLNSLYPDYSELITVLLLGGALFIIYYSLYVLVFAELYSCKYCGNTFYVSFSKNLFLKLYGASNRYMNGHVNDEYLWWKKITCPHCSNELMMKDSIVADEMLSSVNLYEVLDYLGIIYDEISHKAVKTVEDAIKVSSKINGFGTKSLFLTDGDNYYLVILSEYKKANIKELSRLVGSKKLSFASPSKLKWILNLEAGSVSPFGIINDEYNQVTLLIDKDLMNCKLLFHPNINTKTISISYDDLIKFIEFKKHKYIIF